MENKKKSQPRKKTKKKEDKKSFYQRLTGPLNIASVTIGVGGLIFAVFIFILNKPVKRVDMIKLSYINIVPEPPLKEGIFDNIEIQVLLNGNPIKDLKQAIFGLRNSGNTEIEIGEKQILYIQFPENINLLKAEPIDKPEEMHFIPNLDKENRRINFDFDILKPDEVVTFSVLLQGDLPQEAPILKGRIAANIRNIYQIEKSEEQSQILNSLSNLSLIIPAIVVMMIIMVFINYLFFPKKAYLDREELHKSIIKGLLEEGYGAKNKQTKRLLRSERVGRERRK